MRRQDELRVLYHQGDVWIRKYLLSQAEPYGDVFDSEELLWFLQEAVDSGNDLLASQALFSLTRFLPTFVQRRFMLTPPRGGIWSLHVNPGQENHAPDEASAAAVLAHARWYGSAMRIVGPLVGSHSRRGNRGTSLEVVRGRHALALAQFPSPEVRSALEDAVRNQPDEFAPLLARTLAGRDRTGSDVLGVIEGALNRVPEVAFLTFALAPADVHDLVSRCVSGLGRRARVALVHALPDDPALDLRSLLKQIVRTRDPWPTLYLLRRLETLGDPADLVFLEEVFRKSSIEFLRVQAVCAMGGIIHPRSLDLLLEASQVPGEAIRAQALESLVRVRCPRETLIRVSEPLCAEGHLRTRINAILASCLAREATLPAGLMELLFHEDPLPRLEAAFALGYIQDPRSVSYLETLAFEDPQRVVRVQAIKSLSKYPARQSLPVLMQVLSQGDEICSATASRVITRFEGTEAGLVCDALRDMLVREEDSLRRALGIRALGTLGARLDLPEIPEALDRGLASGQDVEVRGALEGLVALGGSHLSDHIHRLQDLTVGRDPAVSLAACFACVLGGAPDYLAPLASGLSGEQHESRIASDRLIELGLLLSEPDVLKRYPGLVRSLASSAPAGGDPDDREVSQPPLRPWASSSRDPESLPPGEFTVRRRHAPPGPGEVQATGSAGSGPAGPGADQNEPGPSPARLRERLRDAGVVASAGETGFLERIRRGSYVIGAGMEGPAPAALRRYGWLLVPVLAIGTILGVVLGHESGHSGEASRPRHPLVVDYVFPGEIPVTGQAPLRIGRPLTRGEIVATDRGQRVRLKTGSGNRIEVFPESSITLSGVEGPHPDLDLELTSGALRVSSQFEGRLTIEMGFVRISGEVVSFTLERAGDQAWVQVTQGELRTVPIDGAGRTLLSGESLEFP